MRILRYPVVGGYLLALGARLLRWLLMGLSRTCRVEIVHGREHLDRLVGDPQPVILSLWHNRSFLAARFVLDELHFKGVDVTLLASQSRDGELVTRMVAPWRMRTIRGSATRGGRKALRLIYRAIVEEKSSPAMIPDGPHGPIYQFKLGVAVLSQMSQAPILPFGLAAERFWRIRSWDRLIVPRPFTRIFLTIGEPYQVARGLSAAELEEERLSLEKQLDDLTTQAEAAAGVEDSARPQNSTAT